MLNGESDQENQGVAASVTGVAPAEATSVTRAAQDTKRALQTTVAPSDAPKSGVEWRPSEKTHIYQPISKEPEQSRRFEPAVPRPSMPTKLGVPAAFATANKDALNHEPSEPPPGMRGTLPKEEDIRTRAYSATQVNELLRDTAAPTPGAVTGGRERPTEAPGARRLAPTVATTHEDKIRACAVVSTDVESGQTAPSKRATLANGCVESNVDSPNGVSNSRRTWWTVAGCVVLAVAFAWGLRKFTGQQLQRAPSEFSNNRSSKEVAQADNTAVESAPSSVVISVNVSPADARITIDDVPVTNPFLTHRKADTKAHVLTAEAIGFAPLRRQLQFEHDLTVVLALAPIQKMPVTANAVQELLSTRSAANLSAQTATASNSKVTGTLMNLKRTAAAVRSNKCDPPYTIDEANVKTFKRECL